MERNARIIELANMIVANEPDGPDIAAEIHTSGIHLVWLAAKMIAGEGCCMPTDNPETASRAKEIALLLGVKLEELTVEQSGHVALVSEIVSESTGREPSSGALVFYPAARH